MDSGWVVPKVASGAPERRKQSAIHTAVGHAAEWHEAAVTFGREVPHTFVTREVVSAPGADEMDRSAGQSPWQVMRAAAATLIARAALMPGCDALELRYVAEPRVSGPNGIHMFLTAKVRGWNPEIAEAALDAACDALPSGFTWAEPSYALGLGGPPSTEPIVELRRREEVTEPTWPDIPTEFYYTVDDEPGDGFGWSQFWRSLSNCRNTVTVSLLFLQTDLDWEERAVLGVVVTDLALFSEPRTEMNQVFEYQEFFPGCENAKVALGAWTKRLRELQRPLLARAAVRGEASVAVPIATALAAALGATSQDSTAPPQPMFLESPTSERDLRQAAFSFDWLEILPWGGHQIWTYENAPMTLRRMPYLFGLREAASLALLPVPDEQGCAGMPRARRATHRRADITNSSGGPGIRLGSALHYGEAADAAILPLTAINRHSLIVGASGSGKTTTVLTMLAELWREHRIPFFVIEPSKREYRSLLTLDGFEDMRVLCLGRDDIAPLRLNPLAPPPGVRREVHANSVLASLKLALPLFPPLPQLLDEAIDRAYAQAGWDYDTTSEAGLRPPTLRSVQESFESIFTQKGYSGEARNVGVAFGVRLATLLRGSRGRVLDTVESVDFEDLMHRPVVVELDDLTDSDDKAVFAAFLLDRLRASARGRGSTAGRLEHVTVIEEAHRLLARSGGATQGDSGDTARADTVKAFCDAIAELRSVGEGFILSTQNPSDLARAAVSNTATRIIHRLEDAADRSAVLDDLDASQLDREAAARLAVGEAIVRWPTQDEASLIKVQAATGVDSGHPVTNAYVQERMSDVNAATRSLMPYVLCTTAVCTTGCSTDRRSSGRDLAMELGEEAGKIWREKNATAAALDPIVDHIASHSFGDRPLTYCTAVHLAVDRQAFTVARRVDIRPQLIRSVQRP